MQPPPCSGSLNILTGFLSCFFSFYLLQSLSIFVLFFFFFFLIHSKALAGAKQVHVFDRTADETISWIQEKDALLTAEDCDNNLETIQALVRKHEGFEADLAAVKEQVFSQILVV